jgi:MFS family permease
MVVIRFLFGVGEAGCFPIIAKSLATWLPRRERTRAQGLIWMAARWGGAFTPLLVVWALQFVNWRVAFVLFGALDWWIASTFGMRVLLYSAIAVFVVAWIGQFIGHVYEGHRPSFFTDLVFLLVGPMWTLRKLYQRLGLGY